jgi:hypothetical protein
MSLNGRVRVKDGPFQGQTGTIINPKADMMIVMVQFDEPDPRLLTGQMLFWRYMLESIPPTK